MTALRHTPAQGDERPPSMTPAGNPRLEILADSHGQSNPFREPRIRRILVPTDFSPADTKAAQQAVALARLLGATLTFLHVIDVADPSWLRFAGTSDEFMRQLRTKAVSEMDHLIKSMAGAPIEVESLIVEGMPWEEIVARARDFDLVIMVRPRPRRFWRLFSRQTTQRVLHRAECGVLVVQE